MTERKLMSLREIEVLFIQDQQYSSWRVSGNAVELKTFLSDGEMKEVLGTKNGIKTGPDEKADDVDMSVVAVEQIEYYYGSEYSESLEGQDVSLDTIEVGEIQNMFP
ncbi:unnamed protein product [Calypogeia fissa]